MSAPAESRPTRIVDLSHVIRHGMVTYPGLPAPEIGEHLTRQASREVYAAGTEFSISRIAMIANTGTYLDSPFHRFAEGADVAGLLLSGITDLEGVVIKSAGGRAIGPAALTPYDVKGKAVLIHTGWDENWGTERYGSDYPFLTRDAAEWLARQQPALVGIDSVNIDDSADGSRPAHTALLDAGIPIVENLRGLEQLPSEGFRFHAAPPAIEGMGTFPVRAYAIVDAGR